MRLPKELEFEALSVEEKYHRAVHGYMKRLCSLYEAIYERFGDDGLELPLIRFVKPTRAWNKLWWERWMRISTTESAGPFPKGTHAANISFASRKTGE